MSTVLVLNSKGKQRARKISPWLEEGASRVGDEVKLIWDAQYKEPCTDVLVHYGFDGSRNSIIAKAHNDYVKAGLKAVYVDIGYFKLRFMPDVRRRGELDRYNDYQRFSINGRHPNAYFQNRKHAQDRADAVGATLSKKMRQGERIVVCGMSPKATAFDQVPEWEQKAIDEIRRYTKRQIVYRPKPQRTKRPQLPPIPGVGYSDPLTRTLEAELATAWAVVSHHSNAGLDALCYGVPCFQEDGVAAVLGLADLRLIEHPRLPSYEARRQLLNDVCYCQFNGAEIRSGIAWRHFKNEGLL